MSSAGVSWVKRGVLSCREESARLEAWVLGDGMTVPVGQWSRGLPGTTLLWEGLSAASGRGLRSGPGGGAMLTQAWVAGGAMLTQAWIAGMLWGGAVGGAVPRDRSPGRGAGGLGLALPLVNQGAS